ncbi:MAG: MerR family DNA-binding protein [Alteromonadaceae bacterium]|nr:MerR family DNA-binding protein [Alteromonadaceae bacterium]
MSHEQKTSPLTIGAIAKAADVNIEKIRYYQWQALIIEPKKPVAGFRHYPVATIDRISFIKQAQQLGFSLKEIRQLLSLGDKQYDDVKSLAIEKRDRIKEQIAGLLTIQSALNCLISSCKRSEEPTNCGFIEALSQQGFVNIKQENK